MRISTNNSNREGKTYCEFRIHRATLTPDNSEDREALNLFVVCLNKRGPKRIIQTLERVASNEPDEPLY